MARRRRPTGFSLIEVIIAMFVLLVGAVGLLALQRHGVQLNADARILTRATSLAQDLVTQMQFWDYANDPRLRNVTTTNDVDFADGAGAFQGNVVSGMYDHEEAELESQAAPYTWLGTATATVQAFPFNFRRYWNVAEVDIDENGVVTAKRIAVIVRWDPGSSQPDQATASARRVVLVTVLKNPLVSN